MTDLSRYARLFRCPESREEIQDEVDAEYQASRGPLCSGCGCEIRGELVEVDPTERYGVACGCALALTAEIVKGGPMAEVRS